MDPFIGQIMLVGWNFAPRGWAYCDGRLLPIATYSALFSLLGTAYGGDGITNFALPDLRGRVPVGFGVGPGLGGEVRLGAKFGNASVTLTPAQLPPHSHAMHASADEGDSALTATNAYLPGAGGYADASPAHTLASGSVGNTGGGQPLDVRPPSLGLAYVIALEGIYPSRA